MRHLADPSRRDILHAAAGAGVITAMPVLAAGEPPPETRRIRIARFPFDLACVAPMWIAEELLRAEGFEAIEYLNRPAGDQQRGLADGELDFGITDIFSVLPALDIGMPTMVLGGVHSGCFELFANPQMRSVRDLKGKTVVVANAGRKAFVSAMVAHVGLDPRKDVTFLDYPGRQGIQLLEQGKVDAFLGFAPEPQEMRARKIGVSVVNTATDRPWSQYFCCVAISNRDFVASNPVATRRALRALLKATDICAAEPDRVTRTLVERGFLKSDAYAAQALGEIPYKRWREYDSADSLRFYALRLHEAGVIKSNPQKLLAQGTNWRFIEQLKKEMKT
jgi:NitT/TauT family transport system substrate-binding protein